MDNCGKTPRCPLMCPSNPYLMSWFIFALSNRSLIYETASPSHTVFVLAVQWALIASFSSLSAHWQGRHTFCCNEQSSSSSAPLFTPLWSLTQKTLISEVEKKTVSFKCKFEKKGQAVIFSVLENHKQKGEVVSHTVDTMLISARGPLLMHLSQTGCRMRNHL